MEAKVDPRIWVRVNSVILGENAGTVMVTFISGMCSVLIHTGVCHDELQARVHLAAMMLSPEGAPVGSLLPLLQAELDRLKEDA